MDWHWLGSYEYQEPGPGRFCYNGRLHCLYSIATPNKSASNPEHTNHFRFDVFFGWGLYHTIIKRVIERDLFTSLLATFGLAIVIQQLINLAYGPDVQTADAGMEIREFFGGEITIADTKLVSFLFGISGGSADYIFHEKK
ncbi:MAG: hypothetical protein CM1200mP30_25470 [Pseudomonadota bacterium]|nr:MAG: hypothetical protein CM1200mP30_25470 [Pseudomonadota bacterium]